MVDDRLPLVQPLLFGRVCCLIPTEKKHSRLLLLLLLLMLCDQARDQPALQP